MKHATSNHARFFQFGAFRVGEQAGLHAEDDAFRPFERHIAAAIPGDDPDQDLGAPEQFVLRSIEVIGHAADFADELVMRSDVVFARLVAVG